MLGYFFVIPWLAAVRGLRCCDILIQRHQRSSKCADRMSVVSLCLFAAYATVSFVIFELGSQDYGCWDYWHWQYSFCDAWFFLSWSIPVFSVVASIVSVVWFDCVIRCRKRGSVGLNPERKRERQISLQNNPSNGAILSGSIAPALAPASVHQPTGTARGISTGNMHAITVVEDGSEIWSSSRFTNLHDAESYLDELQVTITKETWNGDQVWRPDSFYDELVDCLKVWKNHTKVPYDEIIDPKAHAKLTFAFDLLRDEIATKQQLMAAALDAKDFLTMKTVSQVVKHWSSVLPDTPEKVKLGQDAVVPGLVLRRDRFDVGSDSYLGGGTFGAVSKGTLVETVGTQKFKTTVAVKEVHRMGISSSKEALRALRLLQTHFPGGHPNILPILDIKTSPSMVYVVMKLCHFSLDNVPKRFKDFVRTDTRASTHHREASATLNALAEDLLRAMDALHSKHIMHCDVKARQRQRQHQRAVLVDFDPSYHIIPGEGW